MITEVLIFAYYKKSIKAIMKTNLSDYDGNKVFSQLVDDGLLHLVVFFSKNLNPTEYNYKIYNKE